MKRKIIPYNPALKEKARELRNNSTLSEVLLWNELKGKNLNRYDFHRQKPIGNYIVYFFCNELMLAIEIDGDTHYGREEQDLFRQKEIEKYEIEFLRFDDLEIKFQMEKVLTEIKKWIVQHKKSPLERGDSAKQNRGV